MYYLHVYYQPSLSLSLSLSPQRGDSHQLLRIYGSKCKLHLDPKTASSLDSMMSVSLANECLEIEELSSVGEKRNLIASRMVNEVLLLLES